MDCLNCDNGNNDRDCSDSYEKPDYTEKELKRMIQNKKKNAQIQKAKEKYNAKIEKQIDKLRKKLK